MNADAKQQNEYERIAQYIADSDLPRKAEKLDGLRRCVLKQVRMQLRGDMILVEGTSIDPSELENGHWL